MSRSRSLVGLAALAIGGCGPPAITPLALPDEVLVAAASDLREVLPEIVAAFEKQYHAKVTITFGSSGQLAEQIRNGAPFDLFLAANRGFVAELAEEGFVVRESVAPYATGALTLAVGPGCGPAVPRLDELAADTRIRHVAIAHPDLAPYGAAARQALERAGAWAGLAPKIAPVDTVDQAAQVVATGAAEAGLVSVAGAEARGLAHVPVDPSLYDPLVQYLGLATAAAERSAPRRFAAFLNSPTARAAFAARGFGPPGSTP